MAFSLGKHTSSKISRISVPLGILNIILQIFLLSCMYGSFHHTCEDDTRDRHTKISESHSEKYQDRLCIPDDSGQIRFHSSTYSICLFSIWVNFLGSIRTGNFLY